MPNLEICSGDSWDPPEHKRMQQEEKKITQMLHPLPTSCLCISTFHSYKELLRIHF